jgi:hypothetical protein
LLLVLSFGRLPGIELANAATSPLFSREYGFAIVDGVHVTPAEYAEQRNVAAHVSAIFKGLGYDDQNNWDDQTTYSRVMSDIETCKGFDVTFGANFWVGDYAGSPYDWETMYADNQAFQTYDSSTLEDVDIWWAMVPQDSKYYFNFLWTCTHGGRFYDSSGHVPRVPGLTGQSYANTSSPEPTTYPWIGGYYTYYYEPWGSGMAYAWTGHTDLVTDGFWHRQYLNGPADDFCFIGFQNHSPGMLDVTLGSIPTVRGPMSSFPTKFYDYATGHVDGINHPIWQCLEYASLYTFDCNYENSHLYHHYGDSLGWWWDNTVDGGLMAGWWYNYMNVFGNSGITLAGTYNPEITASADDHSNISPSGTISVDYGADQPFTMWADPGYHITHVYVDTVDQGPISTYTFNDVGTEHTISVVSASSTYSTVTVQSVDDGTSWPVPTDVYVNGEYKGYISGYEGISFVVQTGSVITIEVDDPVPTGYPDLYWFFWYFDAGSGGNPTTLTVTDEITITAHYSNGYG